MSKGYIHYSMNTIFSKQTSGSIKDSNLLCAPFDRLVISTSLLPWPLSELVASSDNSLILSKLWRT